MRAVCATLVVLGLATSALVAAAAVATRSNAAARYAAATRPNAVPAPGTNQAPAADTTPLLTYASTHHYPPVLQPATQATLQKQIARITFDLSKDPPPAENCAQTLGAKRFATLYDDLGQAYPTMAEPAGPREAYAKPIACNPGADFLHAERAASLLDL